MGGGRHGVGVGMHSWFDLYEQTRCSLVLLYEFFLNTSTHSYKYMHVYPTSMSNSERLN
jgi:hypothetical protein